MFPTGDPSVSGALACGLRDSVTELVGGHVAAHALSRLAPDLRGIYQTMVPVGWIPISTMEAAFAAIAAEIETPLAELHVRAARLTIERTMRTIWRVLLRVTTDAALVSRTPLIYARSYNRGRLEAHITASGRAEALLLDWPDVPDWTLRGTRIGIDVGMNVAGRHGVRVDCSRTSSGASFVVTWR
jgi:hypothetical protein